MANLYTITETILSASNTDTDAFVASSIQTWTYANEEHAQLAFASIADELQLAYPKGNDGEFTIVHNLTKSQLTLTITLNDHPHETISLQLHAHSSDDQNWWQSLASNHEQAVTTHFQPQPSYFVVTKSLISGHSSKDEDGFASTLQTWTYANHADAVTDFDILVTELEQTYPLGMHEDGFEVSLQTMTDDTCAILITQDGEPYETILVEQHVVTAKSAQNWWKIHAQKVITKW